LKYYSKYPKKKTCNAMKMYIINVLKNVVDIDLPGNIH
jgi:hypothetical protein